MMLFSVVAALWAGAAAEGPGGWRCAACQDVVKAMRERSARFVATTSRDVVPWGGALPLGCSRFEGDFENGFRTCEGMRQYFASDVRFTSYLNSVAGEKLPDVGPWEACVHLAQCGGAYENVCRNYDALHQVPSKDYACPVRCRVCQWLVRSWPSFRGFCSAAESTVNAGTPPEVLLPPGEALANLTRVPNDGGPPEQVPRGGRVPGPNSPLLSEAKDTVPADTDTLRLFCHHLAWAACDVAQARRFVTDPRVTHLGPHPWNPALACACLGQCAFDSIEGLGVTEACDSPP